MKGTHIIIALIVAVLALSGAVCLAADEKPKSGKTASNTLDIKVLKESLACDKQAQHGDKVTVHYDGRLKSNGQMFDSSRQRGQPFSFDLGAGRVIRGWEEGLVGMCPGELRRLTIPPHLGYGDRGAGDVIPPGATLEFDVELVSITRPSITDNLNTEVLWQLAPIFIFIAIAVFFVYRASQVEVQAANKTKGKRK